MIKLFKVSLLAMIISLPAFPQFGTSTSGGKLLTEQAAFDVKYYDINIEIDPDKKFISGYTIIHFLANDSLSTLLLDLDSVFTISKIESITGENKSLNFEHTNGRIEIKHEFFFPAGIISQIKIAYSGMPRVAQRPPWDDGFVWSTTGEGKTWAGVTCQGGGADIWWPCKDHPSDEADSVAINLIVPADLFCASNGRLRNISDNGKTKTYNWFVSTPINNYNISFNLAPYREISYDYTSTTGEQIPFTVWVLPESYDTALIHSKQFVEHLKFFEETCGPYPFRGDKYGVAETPYLGMEHQTIIAYGNGYKNNEFGFDWLHHHELAHEWWGNLVTAKDWSDFWIHEGIGAYMQALYAEKLNGIGSYHSFMRTRKLFSNEKPIAQRKELTSDEAYIPDIYNKGAWVVHTLRYYLGDELFFKVIRRWAYPDPEMEKIKTGGQCRFATTDELLMIAEEVSGKKLDWFFEIYLRQPKLPNLVLSKADDILKLKWETENNISFPMPVEIKINNEIIKINMEENAGEIKIPAGSDPVIDPLEWILSEVKKQNLN